MSQSERELTLPPLTVAGHGRALVRWILPKTPYYQSITCIMALLYLCSLLYVGVLHSLWAFVAMSITFGVGLALMLIRPALMFCSLIWMLAVCAYRRLTGTSQPHCFDHQRQYWRQLGHPPLIKRGSDRQLAST